jgi:hypothetical protein
MERATLCAHHDALRDTAANAGIEICAARPCVKV